MRADRSRLPDVGPDPAFRFPLIARHTLRNGLQVRTVEHHTVPVVTMVVQIDGGAVADPLGREGLAAITADMVDEGTGSLSAIEVSEGLARIGADFDVDVGADLSAGAVRWSGPPNQFWLVGSRRDPTSAEAEGRPATLPPPKNLAAVDWRGVASRIFGTRDTSRRMR